jgi:hypothetical protein
MNAAKLVDRPNAENIFAPAEGYSATNLDQLQGTLGTRSTPRHLCLYHPQPSPSELASGGRDPCCTNPCHSFTTVHGRTVAARGLRAEAEAVGRPRGPAWLRLASDHGGYSSTHPLMSGNGTSILLHHFHWARCSPGSYMDAALFLA